MDPLRAICAQSVVFLRREAIALGYDDRALARARRVGVLHRVRRGAYLFADDWARLDATGRHLALTAAVLRTAETEMVLSHVTAAAAHGAPLWDVDLREVHVTRTDGRAGRREAGVVQHSGELPRSHVTRVHGVPVTTPARTACDVLTILDVEHGLCVLDALLRAGKVTKAELHAMSERLGHTPGSLSTGVAVRLSDARSESVGESRTRFMFWRQGLPAPIPQFEVCTQEGLVVARVDFAWPDLGVFVEFDGRVKYEKLLRPGESASEVVVREKRREELICRLTGWRCVRLVWSDLATPAESCALIRDSMRFPAA